MRKSFKWILAIFVIASVFCGVGCKPEVESDKTAPADVTNFFAENKDSSVLLTWVDAEDKDVYGYEITWDGSVSNNRSAAMEKNSMMVAPGLEMCYINNLINGNKYTFTIKTVDTSGNESLGVSVSIIPEYIDRIPPSQIENIVITYSKNLNKFLLSWINPDDEDFAGVIITYGKKDSDDFKTIEVDKTATTSEIINIEDDDSLYTISFQTVDANGNKSNAKTIIAATGVYITDISLNRTHLDNLMINRDIEVTVTGWNFDLLTSLLIQVTDGVINQPPVKAVINAENNTATAIVTAPIPDSPTSWGKTYTIKAIIDSITPSETVTNFVVSTPAEVTDVWLSQNQIALGSEEEIIAAVRGENFDIRGETVIKLFDSSNVEVVTSTITVPLSDNIDNTMFKAIIPLPLKDDIYTMKIYFDGIQDKTSVPSLQVYGSPRITSIKIPIAGESFGGNKIPITIIGKNFTASGVSESSFTGQGAGIKNFKILSDTQAIAEVTCPYITGITEVSITCIDSTKSGILKVVESEKCFSVGDILFTDGTRMKAENVKYGVPDEQLGNAFGVVGVVSYGGGTGLVVGLQRGSGCWAPWGTTGYETNFTGIRVAYSGETNNYTFTGDLDGSDNWEYICSIDPSGTQNASTNYPVFDFANKYGSYAGLVGTEYENGWYVPSIAELYDVYTNKTTIQTSMDAAGGFGVEGWYWSSSQNSSLDYYACDLNFDSGSVYDNPKNGYYHVLVLQALNAE